MLVVLVVMHDVSMMVLRCGWQLNDRGAFQETWLPRSETGTSSQDDLTLNFLPSQR